MGKRILKKFFFSCVTIVFVVAFNFFLFRIRKDSAANNPGFATMMLAVMAARYDAMKGGMTCKTCLSDDGINHFALYRR